MSARPGLCGGHQATGVPTAIAIFLRQWPRVTIAPPKSEPHVVSLRESRLLVGRGLRETAEKVST